MGWYRKNPLFATVLTVCAVLVLGELWCIYERWAASRAAAAKVVQKQGELAAMREVTPPPNRETATAIEADLERAQRALTTMQGELKGRGPAVERLRAAKAPSARTDAYFDLATYVEKMREFARRNEVDVRPEAARFGFAAYANEGPEADRIEAVFQQRQIAQFIVEALVESHPRAVLAVKREPPMTKKEREDRATAARAAADGSPPPEPAEPAEMPEGPDYFVIHPRATARVPGYVETLPYQVVFIGQTAALRTFLNRLATFELPIVVREVEVEPATIEDTAASETTGDTPAAAAPAENAAPAAPSVVLSIEGASGAGKAGAEKGRKDANATPPAVRKPPRTSTAEPIVARPWSKFTVTVEYIDLVPSSADAADASAAPAAPGS